ncbi:manganese superoxide dismutase [Hysterangium stoloniferum]|nr:manganese superoxide dismutase [Hysterangium stoloniferum]
MVNLLQYVLPSLPCPYNALEPFQCEEMMLLHYIKHQSYVNGLNSAEKTYAPSCTPKELIGLQAMFKFNVPPSEKGGNGGVLKDGPLKEAINREFGSLEHLKKEKNHFTAGIQGSGWGWLGLYPNKQKSKVVTTLYQNLLLCMTPFPLYHAFTISTRYLNNIWNVIHLERSASWKLEARSESVQ